MIIVTVTAPVTIVDHTIVVIREVQVEIIMGVIAVVHVTVMTRRTRGIRVQQSRILRRPQRV